LNGVKKLAYFLYGLFFVSCIVLIGSVLLQPGKTDAGALFTSNVSSTAYTPRGAQTVLSKMTIIAASAFMISALLLAMPALNGNVSVLQTAGETPADSGPALEANSNVQVNQPGDANVSGNPTEGLVPATNGPVANASAPSDEKGEEKKPKEVAKPESNSK
jgi:preprotein translocase subunit SecG